MLARDLQEESDTRWQIALLQFLVVIKCERMRDVPAFQLPAYTGTDTHPMFEGQTYSQMVIECSMDKHVAR